MLVSCLCVSVYACLCVCLCMCNCLWRRSGCVCFVCMSTYVCVCVCVCGRAHTTAVPVRCRATVCDRQPVNARHRSLGTLPSFCAYSSRTGLLSGSCIGRSRGMFLHMRETTRDLHRKRGDSGFQQRTAGRNMQETRRPASGTPHSVS
jgi:hypothetical protein